MRISDGQVILSEFEEREADIAEDDILAIKSILNDLKFVFERLDRKRRDGSLKFSNESLRAYRDIVCDATDDLITKDWARLVAASGSISHPAQLPEIGA